VTHVKILIHGWKKPDIKKEKTRGKRTISYEYLCLYVFSSSYIKQASKQAKNEKEGRKERKKKKKKERKRKVHSSVTYEIARLIDSRNKSCLEKTNQLR
jgi:hypothetical protein